VSIAPNQTVAVSALPAVSIAPNQTVAVRIVDDSTRESFYKNGAFVMVAGQDAAGVLIYTVPSGNRLVLEHISVQANLALGQKVAMLRLSVTGETQTSVYLDARYQGSAERLGPNDRLDHFVANESVHFVLEPDDQVFGSLVRDTKDGQADASFSLAGYLVPL